MEYREAVDYIFGHTNYEVIPRVPHIQANYDLRRVLAVLERLGNPHLKARSLHITGTNGKGSTSAMLASVLTVAGYKTGLYTSPHLHTMRERFMIDGKMIQEAEVAGILSRIRPEIEAENREALYGRLTVFEILTILCFAFFAEKNCDFQVMEVGMGGRFDATNVIHPEICLLTSISYDHTEVLGNTLSRIAAEKCGIIKPGCTVISHPQAGETAQVIRKVCREKSVNLIQIGRDVTWKSLGFDLEHQQLEVQGRLRRYTLSLPLLGECQMDNAAAAVAALEVLTEKGALIPVESILKGIGGVRFPGRMQIFSRDPFIVIDGGHNPGAVHCLAESLRRYFDLSGAVLVIGASGDKDIQRVVQELAPLFRNVVVTRANNPRSVKPEVLVEEFTKHGIEAQITGDIPQALFVAKKKAAGKSLICVTGSMFVAGEAIDCLNLPESPGADT